MTTKKKINQSKVNKMILSILKDIAGLSTVYSSQIAQQVMNLSTYLEFGKELKDIKFKKDKIDDDKKS